MNSRAPENYDPTNDPTEPLVFLPNHSSDSEFVAYKPRGLPLLVLDQNTQVRKACREIAETLKFTVAESQSSAGARKILMQRQTAILLLDVTHTKNENQSLLEEMKTLYPETPVIAMSANASIADAVEIMRMGACDYLSKPFPLNVLTEALERAAGRWHFGVERRRLQEMLRPEMKMADALGQSIEMEKLYRTLSNVADSSHPVMILGENGTGKALVAQSIHSNSRHSSKPFVSLDCTSLGPALLESTLFGDTKCSPDKANMQKSGLLTSSQGGTIFLNEIGDIPLGLQGKLTKALQEKHVVPSSGSKAVCISVRVLAATSRDLTQMVREGLFRMDFYRLLSVVNLRIPPLRGRPDDIAFLTRRFLEKIQRQTGQSCILSKETLQMLETYDWPDNVRELEDTIARACSQSSGPELEPIHLPQKLLRFHRNATGRHAPDPFLSRNTCKSSGKHRIIPIAKVEERAILEAMRETNGDKLRAAELLGIGKTTLYRKLKEYGSSDDSNPTAAQSSSAISTTDATDTQPIPSCA